MKMMDVFLLGAPMIKSDNNEIRTNRRNLISKVSF